MAKAAVTYRCTECGWTTVKWVGRCGECQEWGTVAEAAARTGVLRSLTPVTVGADRAARAITEIGVFGIILNVVAVFGCLVAARLDTVLGSKKVVMTALVLLIIATIGRHHACFKHYHTAGVSGRNEIGDQQELHYPAICRAIRDSGFKGYLAQEFMPAAPDPVGSLREAIRLCDV